MGGAKVFRAVDLQEQADLSDSGIGDVKHIVLVVDLGAGVAGGYPVLRRTLGGDGPDERRNSHFFYHV